MDLGHSGPYISGNPAMDFGLLWTTLGHFWPVQGSLGGLGMDIFQMNGILDIHVNNHCLLTMATTALINWYQEL